MVKRAARQECRIEVFWRQWASGTWLARLIDLESGEQREARSETEIRAALLEWLEGPAAPAGDPEVDE